MVIWIFYTSWVKRINPITNLTYRRGDLRADGKFFIQYLTKNLDDEGFYKLKFGEQSWIKRSNKNALAWQKSNKAIHNKRNSEQSLKPRYRAFLLFSSARNRAKKFGLEFNLTKLWVLQKIEQGTCEISGEKFEFKPHEKFNFNPYSPSLDRIDSKGGYTRENCRVILTALNVAINEFGLDLYLTLAKKVISKNKIKL